MVPAVSGTQRDIVQPFMIEAGAIRGRLVRLGPSVDEILKGHDYPAPVAQFMAETLVLAATLAASLKYDGVFTLQIQTKGAIPLLVADVTSDGALRGYARYDEALLAQAQKAEGAPVPRFLGEGYLAFTVDQGAGTERYQGIVELAGEHLADSALEYFSRSEQLASGLKLAAQPAKNGQGWQAAAIMIQRMPTSDNSPILTAAEQEESWRRASILMASVKESELFDLDLPSEQLLYRLYHADGLSLFDHRSLQARCRCSSTKLAATLKTFPRDEVEEMLDDKGEIAAVCEFCKTAHIFTRADLDSLYGA